MWVNFGKSFGVYCCIGILGYVYLSKFRVFLVNRRKYMSSVIAENFTVPRNIGI